jgi:hypothetical protein
MTDLPNPLTPPDCDLRGYEWMPLWGHRMFSSAWYLAARKDGRGGIAAIKLWWEAMQQHPAGSLPNDEEMLCMIADFGEDMRAWRRHRAVAMHGFILCADNRWYHPFLSEKAVEAYECRLKSSQKRQADAERLRRWRAAQAEAKPRKPNGSSHAETQNETRFDTPSESVRERVRQDRTGKEKEERGSPNFSTKESGPPVAPQHASSTFDPEAGPEHYLQPRSSAEAEVIEPPEDEPKADPKAVAAEVRRVVWNTRTYAAALGRKPSLDREEQIDVLEQPARPKPIYASPEVLAAARAELARRAAARAAP